MDSETGGVLIILFDMSFFICIFVLLAFAGCSDNEEEILTGGNIDIDLLPPNQPNDVFDE